MELTHPLWEISDRHGSQSWDVDHLLLGHSLYHFLVILIVRCQGDTGQSDIHDFLVQWNKEKSLLFINATHGYRWKKSLVSGVGLLLVLG